MSVLLPIRTLLLAIAMFMAGSGVLPTVLGIRLNTAGHSEFLIGLIGAAYFSGLTAGSLVVIRLVTRVGHIRAFAAFVSLYSASALTYSLEQSVPLWFVLRIIDGFCVAGVFVCLESWLNDQADPQHRGATLAYYMVALYSGQAVSQAVLSVEAGNPRLPFVIASLLLSLTVIPVALTRMAGPVIGELTALPLRRLYAISPLGLVGCAMTGVMLGAFYAMGAIHAQRVGMSNVAIAGLMSGVIVGGMTLQWPLGRLSDRFDRRKVIVLAFAITAAICAAMSAMSDFARSGAFTAVGFLFGGFVFALYPLCVAHTNDHLSPSERTGASGGLILAYSAGAALGPLASSVCMAAFGPGGLYGFIGGIAALAFLFGMWRQVIARPVPRYAQGRFQVLPRTTPVIVEFEPESTPDDEADTR